MKIRNWLSLKPKPDCKNSLMIWESERSKKRKFSCNRFKLKKRISKYSSNWRSFKTWRTNNSLRCRWKPRKRLRNLKMRKSNISMLSLILDQRRTKKLHLIIRWRNFSRKKKSDKLIYNKFRFSHWTESLRKNLR